MNLRLSRLLVELSAIQVIASKSCFDHLSFIMQGSSYIPSKLPPKPLEIWAYEVCRLLNDNFGVGFKISFLGALFRNSF